MYSSRRAQVTLFIAVGIVALIFIGIIYLFLKNSSTQDPQHVITKINDNSILEQYLSSCLDSSVNSEFKKIGDTGGIPYTKPYSDGYSYATLGSAETSRRVMYGLLRNNDSDGHYPLAKDVPEYPAFGIGVRNATVNIYARDENGNNIRFYSFQDGYFGDTTFPATCERNGSNSPSGEFPCKYYVDNPPYTKGPSIESYLSNSLTAKVQQCASADVFNKNTGLGIDEIRVSDPEVTFTQDMTLVTFSYQITQQNKTYPLSITRRYPMRIMPIVDFAHDLAREESKNITFNLSSDYQNLPSFRQGFFVQKSDSVNVQDCINANCANHASLVTILDSKSSINGVSYSFSFLMEHRPPMLDEIGSPDDVNPMYWCNTSIDPLIGVDPDDTPVALESIISFDPSVQKHCTTPLGIICTDVYGKCTVTDADGESDWKEFHFEKVLVAR